MTKEEVLKLALEALEAMNPYPASKEEQRNTAITAIKEALAQPEQEPMDTPLPCDVTVGHVTIRKGVALRVLITRMKVLYEMATGQVKFYQKGETD